MFPSSFIRRNLVGVIWIPLPKACLSWLLEIRRYSPASLEGVFSACPIAGQEQSMLELFHWELEYVYRLYDSTIWFQKKAWKGLVIHSELQNFEVLKKTWSAFPFLRISGPKSSLTWSTVPSSWNFAKPYNCRVQLKVREQVWEARMRATVHAGKWASSLWPREEKGKIQSFQNWPSNCDDPWGFQTFSVSLWYKTVPE